MKSADRLRIAILGAGPIGLEAALYARTLGYKVDVYESGRIGENLRAWGHVRLFSPFHMNCTSIGKQAIERANPGLSLPGEDQYLTGREHLDGYLLPLGACDLLEGSLHLNSQVVHIGRQRLLKHEAIGGKARENAKFRLLVRNEANVERFSFADFVLDCSGTYGRHRRLGPGGIPALGESAAAQDICYALDDVLGARRQHYANKSTLVIGGGYSAATSVCLLAELAEESPQTTVYWAVRGNRKLPIKPIANDPLGERDRLCQRANALVQDSSERVIYFYNSEAVSIQRTDAGQFRVCLSTKGDFGYLEVDRLIANVGYSPDNEIYRELQVHECYASLGPMKLAAALLGQQSADCLEQTSPGPQSLQNPEPRFFILGAKSYGRNSLFLMRIGFEQIRDVFRSIAGAPELDLYGDAAAPVTSATS